jgi:hypothetical protein
MTGYANLRSEPMKITPLQVNEAFARAVLGESVRSIARGLGVTEGCLRFHFRKSAHPREVRRVAFLLHHAAMMIAKLTDGERRAVERLTSRQTS